MCNMRLCPDKRGELFVMDLAFCVGIPELARFGLMFLVFLSTPGKASGSPCSEQVIEKCGVPQARTNYHPRPDTRVPIGVEH